jgi:hypothetical protein
MSSTHHFVETYDFRADPHFPLDSTSTVLAAFLAWTMLGLWLYLDHRKIPFKGNKVFDFFFVIFCGPAAWLISIWKANNRRGVVSAKKVQRAPKSVWVAEHWRN